MTSIDQAFLDAIGADIAYVDGLKSGMTGIELRDRIQ